MKCSENVIVYFSMNGTSRNVIVYFSMNGTSRMLQHQGYHPLVRKCQRGHNALEFHYTSQCVRVSLYIVLVSFIFEYNGVHRGYHSPAPTTQRGTQRLSQSCTNNTTGYTEAITVLHQQHGQQHSTYNKRKTGSECRWLQIPHVFDRRFTLQLYWDIRFPISFASLLIFQLIEGPSWS